MNLRQDTGKENWLLCGKCEPVIILSEVGHPTNVSKFQILAGKSINTGVNDSENSE